MTERQKRQLSDRLRRAIEECGRSRYEISRRSGVDQAALSRFMAGGSLKLESIEKLAPVLGIEIVVKAKK